MSLGFGIALYLLSCAQMVSSADILVGVQVPPTQRINLDRLDHSAWNDLLRKYVDEQGLVRYADWNNSREDLQVLDEYLGLLSHTNGQGSREAELAFWINAYNALTIKGILNEYPTSSIRNHTAVLFGYNIWKNLKLIVAGKPIALYDIEHQKLRKLGDPRIHFAIVCASLGCPRLLNEAYVAERLEEQLTRNTKLFFTDARKFRYDVARKTFYVSPILKWFDTDFGDTAASQLRTIADWLPDGPARRAAVEGKGKIAFLDYDWGLNDRR